MRKINKPYGLNALNDFTEILLYSANVKGVKRLSACVVGMPDTGKTETLLQYTHGKGFLIASDVTGYGLHQFLEEIKKKEIRYVVIPDVSRVLEGRGKAGEALISALNSLIEEGVYSIATYHIQFSTKKPVKVGFIGAFTITSFEENRNKWLQLGFLSRLIPFFLGFVKDDIALALECIAKEETSFHKKKISFSKTPKTVTISLDLKNELKKTALLLAKLNEDFTCFRSYKNLIAFAKAKAVKEGRKIVTKEDVTAVKCFVPFWFYPCGSDCDYFILKELPNTKENLVKRLGNHYKEETLNECVVSLARKKLIKKEKEIWELNY